MTQQIRSLVKQIKQAEKMDDIHAEVNLTYDLGILLDVSFTGIYDYEGCKRAVFAKLVEVSK